jgi:CDP-4-dehydro-6-deoxyglucose reductase, E1
MTLQSQEIKLVKDTINSQDINKLIDWLKTNPRLTKGDLTLELEEMWSKWNGCKYSVFVNSGSSANLAAIYALLLSGKLRNKKIIVPAVSWVTTVSPTIQLGMEPILCDCNKDNLGLDLVQLKEIIEKEKPASLILVHALGFPNDMHEITQLCNENDILIIEDTCESIGSMYDGKKLGTIGSMGTYSFYFGHHMSTIEGGMISTDDEELYHLLLSIRSHGWDRDLPESKKRELRTKYNVSDFRALYTFYYPGFNFRSTDLQAFIGKLQMDKIDTIVSVREQNYQVYHENIKNSEWKINPNDRMYISNFAYPIITSKLEPLVIELNKYNIETRPLICGSINKQPFWYERYGMQDTKKADWLHNNGLYLPNNHEMSKDEVLFVVDVVNNILN